MHATFLNLIKIHHNQKWSVTESKWKKQKRKVGRGAQKVTFHCLFVAYYYY